MKSFGKDNRNDDVAKKSDINLSWIYLATSYDATFNSNITGGKVYSYTLNETTIYRFVPSPYTKSDDAFYENFDGTNLSDLIITRTT